MVAISEKLTVEKIVKLGALAVGGIIAVKLTKHWLPLWRNTEEAKIEGKLTRTHDKDGKPQRTLFVRTMVNPGEHHISGGHENPFIAENNVLFAFVTQVADFAVMKYLEDEIPLLCEQEYEHAKAHFKGQKSFKKGNYKMDSSQFDELMDAVEVPENCKRWNWFKWLLNTAFNRISNGLGLAVSGYFEASAWVWFYYLAGYGSNLYVYHGLEELEHGILTVDRMGRRATFFNKVLAAPILFVAYTIWFMCPPLFRIAAYPEELIKPTLIPNLIQYYTIFTPVYFASLGACVFNWLIPFPMWEELHQGMYKDLLKMSEDRGIKYKIEKSETYYMKKSDMPKAITA